MKTFLFKSLTDFNKNTWYPSDEVLPVAGEYVLTYWYGSPVIAELNIPNDKRRKPYWSSEEGEITPLENGGVTYFMVLSNPEI